MRRKVTSSGYRRSTLVSFTLTCLQTRRGTSQAYPRSQLWNVCPCPCTRPDQLVADPSTLFLGLSGGVACRPYSPFCIVQGDLRCAS